MCTWTQDVRDLASTLLDDPTTAAACYVAAHCIVNGNATPRSMAKNLMQVIGELDGARWHRRALALYARIPFEATETYRIMVERRAELGAILRGGPYEHLRDAREEAEL